MRCRGRGCYRGGGTRVPVGPCLIALGIGAAIAVILPAGVVVIILGVAIVGVCFCK